MNRESLQEFMTGAISPQEYFDAQPAPRIAENAPDMRELHDGCGKECWWCYPRARGGIRTGRAPANRDQPYAWFPEWLNPAG